MFKVILADRAKEQYDKLNPNVRKKVNRAIDFLGISPFFGPNIRKLKGELQDYWRLRIGDFRIIYSIEKELVFIKVVEHRGKVY